MAVCKDNKTNTYFVKTYYTDYTGAKKQKKKRGFKLKREALDWEREFLLQMQGEPDMTLNSLARLYLKDIKIPGEKSPNSLRKMFFVKCTITSEWIIKCRSIFF